MTLTVSSLVGRSSFRALRSHGTRFGDGPVRLIFRPNEGDLRVAFAHGRAFGGAVQRNWARRRLREAFVALSRRQALTPGDYLFVCSPRVLNLTFSEIETRLERVARAVEAATNA